MSLRSLPVARTLRSAATGRFLIPMLLATGCFGPAGADFTGASASFACGPADEPMVAINLSLAPRYSETDPTISVRLRTPPQDLTPGRWAFPGVFANAAWCPDGLSCPAALDGWVRLDAVAVPGSISGAIEADVPGRGRLRGDFRAGWIAQGIICG